jgi:hypothetical protein
VNAAETLIRTMSKDGDTFSRIAEELYDRGLKNGLGRTYTASMVEGYLRFEGLEDEHLAAVAKRRPTPSAATEVPRMPPYSKEAEPIYEPPRKVRMLRPWPAHTDYSPDNLNPRD